MQSIAMMCICEHYTYRNTFVMFAKEIFDYPELEEHPLLCNHLGKKKYNFFHGERSLFKYRWLSVKMEKKEASVAVQSFM